MAAESNPGFHLEDTFGSALSRHAISFQSAAISCTSEMIPMGNFYGVDSTAGMMLPGTSLVNSNQGITQAGSSHGSLLLDSVPGLKHDIGLAVEWSVDEQYKLEEGLVKFADEPPILRYIKIAATLRDKTVRDVALRCRWMMEKLAESSLRTNISSASPSEMAAYSSLMLHHQEQTDRMPCEALSGSIKHLLEQNNQVFGQISANLSALKLQDNIDLFFRTRNNIAAILNDMRDMPGLMSHMPPLPVCMNEELATGIFPSTAQTLMFGSSSGSHMKQEPGC